MSPPTSTPNGDSATNSRILPIGTRVRCVYNSMMFDSIEHAREVRKNQIATRFTQHQEVKYEERLGVIGGVSDQERHDNDDVIYRIIYDKGEVDQFVRACFVEE